MNKNFIYAMLSAIALTGAVGFSSCTSSDDAAEVNPNYNPENNTVKTEFVINVTQPSERANTRMTSANAGNKDFLGINNMRLICLTNVPGTDNEISDSKRLTLTSYTGPAIDAEDETNTKSSSKVYTLYIPLHTKNFLFYATALASVSDKFANGSLTNNYSDANKVVKPSTPGETDAEIKFNLESIASLVDLTGDETNPGPQRILTAILNGIVDAKISDLGEENIPTGVSVSDKSKTWESTKNVTNDQTQWRALRDAFIQFTNQVGEGLNDVRQGSSDAVLNMVGDLFGAVNAVYTNETDVTAKAMAEAIIKNIDDYFTIVLTAATETTPAIYSWSGSYKAETDGATFNSSKFPETQKLPAGSAVIVYDSNGFTFINNGTKGTAAVSTACANFTYPSQLTYYCNSGLWQTNVSKNTTDYPTTSLTWLSTNWASNGWSDSEVTTATRAVAMKDNITYGAAQLASTIKLGQNVGTTSAPLEDNAASVTNNEVLNNSFDSSSDAKTITLKVHGLLIGGQPNIAEYDYLPPSDDTFSKVIYDRFAEAGTVVNGDGTSNYTLALDNYKAGDGGQSPVNIAFEMTADKDFYGVSGMIKAGQKFYLIGALDPTAGSGLSTTDDWAKHTSFKTGDTGQGVNRVFIRDAKTVANFTLGKNCLKSAYSTIPDLRSTQMLFGISVDLAWKAGLTYDITIGQ